MLREIGFTPKALLKPANLLSLSRIPIAFIMMLFYQDKAIFLLLLVVAIITDILDGNLARFTGKTTRFGAFLDPFCDKLFFLIILVFLAAVSGVKAWQVLLLLSRDILMAVMSAAMLLHPNRKVLKDHMKARWPGKLTTIGIFVALLWMFFGIPNFDYVVYAVAVLAVITVIDYALYYKKQLKI